MTWKRCRKKPLIVEFREVIPNFPSAYVRQALILQSGDLTYVKDDLDCERVETLTGIVVAFPGKHFIIRGVKGEIYPITKELFYETYDISRGGRQYG